VREPSDRRGHPGAGADVGAVGEDGTPWRSQIWMMRWARARSDRGCDQSGQIYSSLPATDPPRPARSRRVGGASGRSPPGWRRLEQDVLGMGLPQGSQQSGGGVARADCAHPPCKGMRRQVQPHPLNGTYVGPHSRPVLQAGDRSWVRLLTLRNASTRRWQAFACTGGASQEVKYVNGVVGCVSPVNCMRAATAALTRSPDDSTMVFNLPLSVAGASARGGDRGLWVCRLGPVSAGARCGLLGGGCGRPGGFGRFPQAIGGRLR
jgi:hypothetical protein